MERLFIMYKFLAGILLRHSLLFRFFCLSGKAVPERSTLVEKTIFSFLRQTEALV